MNLASHKKFAVVAMTEFGLSNLHKPTDDQEQAVENCLDASISINGDRAKQRLAAALRIAVLCVRSINRKQFSKVLMWLLEIAERNV